MSSVLPQDSITARASQSDSWYEPRSGSELIKVAEGPDDAAVLRVLGELSQREKKPPETTSMLLRLLENPNAEVRDMAIWFIGRYDRLPCRVVDPLIAALSDPSPAVREQAACALGVDDRHIKKVLPPLRRALSDPDRLVAAGARHALIRLGYADVPPLKALEPRTDESSPRGIGAEAKCSAMSSMLQLAAAAARIALYCTYRVIRLPLDLYRLYRQRKSD